MTIVKLIKALQIFAKYDCDARVVGQYEEIYVDISVDTVGPEDLASLYNLGFRYAEVDLMMCNTEWDYNE